jgi:hypothetical protein
MLSVLLRVLLNARKSTIMTAILLVSCVPNDREREREREVETSIAGKMQRYPLEMTRCSNIILFVYMLSF